jgi:hypothetical protein
MASIEQVSNAFLGWRCACASWRQRAVAVLGASPGGICSSSASSRPPAASCITYLPQSMQVVNHSQQAHTCSNGASFLHCWCLDEYVCGMPWLLPLCSLIYCCIALVPALRTCTPQQQQQQQQIRPQDGTVKAALHCVFRQACLDLAAEAQQKGQAPLQYVPAKGSQPALQRLLEVALLGCNWGLLDAGGCRGEGSVMSVCWVSRVAAGCPVGACLMQVGAGWRGGVLCVCAGFTLYEPYMAFCSRLRVRSASKLSRQP